MLYVLPIEGVLETLSYLPVQTLRNLQLVCRDWKIFIVVNERSIYKRAALLHGYLPSSDITSVSELQPLYSTRCLTGVEGWKDLCRKRRLIEKGWLGHGSTTVKRYSSILPTVHRIKVDDKAGYIITTSKHGGLFVTDLVHDELLWSLPEEYVRSRAHCEYGNGFLIFDRWDGAKEVWRLACDYDTAICPVLFPPDVFQTRASLFAQLRGSRSRRGHFKPWALLRMPEPGRAFRFVYPTLLVAASNEAYVWDIPTATLSQTISETGLDGQISYVEVSARHVFICGTNVLRIFSREDGRVVLDVSSTRELYADWRLSLPPASAQTSDTQAVLVPFPILHQYDVEQLSHPRVDRFVAVHVSACGSHLVALLFRSRLLVLYNFERVVAREIQLDDAIVDIQLGPTYYSSKYLAFENDRVAVATGYGIFVLSIQPEPDPLEVIAGPRPSAPPLRALPGRVFSCLARCFCDHPLLRRISCLQMTDASLYLNWALNDPLGSESVGENYFHSLIASVQALNAVAGGDDLVDEDIVDVDLERGQSTVFSIDVLPL